MGRTEVLEPDAEVIVADPPDIAMIAGSVGHLRKFRKPRAAMQFKISQKANPFTKADRGIDRDYRTCVTAPLHSGLNLGYIG